MLITFANLFIILTEVELHLLCKLYISYSLNITSLQRYEICKVKLLSVCRAGYNIYNILIRNAF